MTYLLQVSTCWILFFGIYLIFLRKETFFSINRYYLMSTLIVGLLIPFLGAYLPANEASVEVYQVMTTLTAAEITPQIITEDQTPLLTWWNALWATYILGALAVFSRFLYGLNRIFSIYRNAEKTKQEKFTLVKSDKYHLPFSFFHFIFISNKLPLNEEVEKVLKHEELHANQWHSIDIVFTELLQVFFWFNPILILYKSALRQSHEYLADAYVTKDHNRSSYGQLLLRQSTSGLEIALANQFFHSQIKKRITMMYKEKSKRSAMVKYLTAVPVLVAMLLIFSSSKMNQDYSKEVLQEEFKNVYFEVQDPEMDFVEVLSKWKVLLNNFANEDNVEEVTSDMKEVASTFGINLDVGSSEYGKPYEFSIFYYVVPPENLEEWREDTEIESPYNLRFNSDPENNFGGRKIVYRNWESLFSKQKILRGKIAIKAEANANGEMVYVEIIEDRSTVTDREVLKDVLNAAKGYKIEKGSGNVFGELIFNFELPKPQASYYFDTDDEQFKSENRKDGIIQLGEKIHEGTVQVTVNDEKLVEGIDFEINYETGKLQILKKEYLNGSPVKVTFVDQGDPIFKVVEEMPRFPGCEEMEGTAKEKDGCATQKMLEFIYSNLRYPANAREQGVEGTVVVQFIIEKDGKISDAKIVREIGGQCGTESQRVVNEMPTWIPGKQRGKAVRVQYTLPVKFKLEGEKEPVSEANYVKLIAAGEADPIAKKEHMTHNSSPANFQDVFKVVEKMPQFVGCEDVIGKDGKPGCSTCAQGKMLEFIYTNIKYPKEARAKGIDGMAIVQFIVNVDGSVSDAFVVRDPGAGTGAEAKRVVELMPKWIPGEQRGKKVKVSYTLPVKFKLEGDEKVKSNSPNTSVQEMLKGKTSGVNIKDTKIESIDLKSTSGGQKPLFVIDGVIKTEQNTEELDPDNIESINVIKGEKALEKYGKKGENGVIEIILKSGEYATRYLIDGQMFDHSFYKTIDKSHINKEEPASKEDKFMRAIKGKLIEVNMLAGYGFNSAYFPGTNTEDESNQALLTYVGNNIKYPQAAIDNNIEGLVTVNYTVDADGKLTNFKIEKSVGWGLDEAVLDMMEKLAKDEGLWKAAYLDQKSVKSSMVLPIKFKLQDDQKKEAKNRRLDIDRLDISPNPSDGRFNISFELEDKSPVDILFYSINGQLIKEIKGVSNIYRNSVDLSNNTGQTVLVNIVQNGKVHTNKVIIR